VFNLLNVDQSCGHLQLSRNDLVHQVGDLLLEHIVSHDVGDLLVIRLIKAAIFFILIR